MLFEEKIFVDVILPLALPRLYTFGVPEELTQEILVGKRVIVQFGAQRFYTAIINKVHAEKPKEFYENSKPDARVLIYRGKNFLWVNPTIEADSTLSRADLSLGLAREIVAQPSFSSSADARDYVNQIRDVVEQTTP